VVSANAPIVIVDNLGGDEITALANEDITADPDYWESRGFECRVVETHFEFKRPRDARALLGLYFGDERAAIAKTKLTYRVGLFVGKSTGSPL
jgi:hypothetical protein